MPESLRALLARPTWLSIPGPFTVILGRRFYSRLRYLCGKGALPPRVSGNFGVVGWRRGSRAVYFYARIVANIFLFREETVGWLSDRSWTPLALPVLSLLITIIEKAAGDRRTQPLVNRGFYFRGLADS